MTDEALIADWAKPYVTASLAYDFRKGDPSGTFLPSLYLTRAETAVIGWRLISREQVAVETTPEGKFVGSIKSNIYHYLTCKYVKEISPENKIWFYSPEEARAKGYRPCKVFNPP